MIWFSIASLAISTWTLVFLWRNGQRHKRTMAALEETYEKLRRLEDQPQWKVEKNERTKTVHVTRDRSVQIPEGLYRVIPDEEPEPCGLCGGAGQVERLDGFGKPQEFGYPCPACTEAAT